MLNQIHIRDLATIEELHLNLHENCTMITGETGAGKSIFIEAIELALGARAAANMIRPDKERADISLGFDITHFTKVIDWLKQYDLYQDTNECIVRRVITNDGRSRSYINGLPSTLQLVRELGELLFHLHGQYEQQVLFKADNQREIIDRYAEQLPLANEVKQLADEWKAITQQIKKLREKSAEREERCDYLRFQLDELSALQLKAGEWDTLETEHHKLTRSDDLLHNLQHALTLLADDDNHNVLSALNELRKSLESIQSVDKKATGWLATLNSTLIQLGDLEVELRDYLESTEIDPARLQYIEQLVTQMFDLARKHKIKPDELLGMENKLKTEFDTLNSSDETLEILTKKQQTLAEKYAHVAATLSKNRALFATTFAKKITESIRHLSLPHAEFSVALEKNHDDNLSPHGLEKIIFLIKTNPDQSPQPLAKVVSGGELSRLSLAVHLALAHQTSTPTLIFDEVDTGVGGATAEKIGKLLRQLGETYQVFCVTHLPQVAAMGHHHLLVEKYFIEKKTHTRLRLLDTGDKTNEIARMLGGEKITQKTLEHAEEMLAG
jgi:DNA repair protein RecN (Recombination protein N)